MNLRWLKPLRVAVATAFLVGLTLAFLGYRIPWPRGAAGLLASTQFVPAAIKLATGAGLALAALIILGVTLAAGRIYCSAICPLGIVQDVILRVAKLLRGRTFFLRYAKAVPVLRYVVLALALIAIPFTGLAWLDPYSIFGRTVALLVRPIVFLANNALVPFAAKWHLNGLHRLDVPHIATAALLGVGAMTLVVVVMAALRGRLYCNTICPVGTLLGLISARAALKLKINAATCGKCADCLKSCKAQCIDLKAGTVDVSRCVSCYNCLTACDQGAMHMEFDWKRTSPASSETTGHFDTGRRQFLLTAAGGALVAGACAVPSLARADEHEGKRDGDGKDRGRKFHNVITPPIAIDTEQFLAHCTACQLCISSCSTGVLQPALLEYGPLHLLKPHMDYSKAFCNYTCFRCSSVCPTGAIPKMPLPEKQVTRIGTAHFNHDNCIVAQYHTDCGACSEHCPTKAVHMVPYENGLSIPEVDRSLCIGCGACQFACPADEKAIVVHGAPKDKQARRPGGEKPLTPAEPKKDGFPF